MSESNQSPGIKLTPLLLLAIPLAMYSHSKGIGIEDIRNYLLDMDCLFCGDFCNNDNRGIKH